MTQPQVNIISPRKLKGFRDFLPEDAALRRGIQDKIWGRALRAGFLPIDTPVLEYAETLLGSGGAESDKEVYRFIDHGEREVALRFDLTVPFARFVAENYAELTFPFKKIQIGNAWRGEKPQKGRYREFCQADLDIIGVDSLAADVEVLACILGNLQELIAQPFTMAVGHRVILSALIQVFLPELVAGGEGRVLIALDKLMKIGPAAVQDLILQIEGAEATGIVKLLATLQARDADGHTDLKAVEALLNGSSAAKECRRLAESVSILRELTAGSQAKVCIDLTIARGLGYYTGVVFETTIDGLDGFGSIASGGRYNGLVSRFSKQELAGVGGSIGVDRLAAALQQLGITASTQRMGVFIALAGEEARSYGFKLLNSLRQAGLTADIALKEGKLAPQFKFADKRQYRQVLTLGSAELETQTVSLKDMQSGTELKGLSWDAALTMLLA